MVASTRFREYFDPKMAVLDGVRRGNIETVEMLSSVPPAVPVIIDVVPILRWKEEDAPGGERISSRRAVGLRVWLARPWFSSGAGEMLALVCDKGGPLGPDNLLYHEVTHVSQDPSHASVMPRPLRIGDFQGADIARESVEIPAALGTTRSDIAAFRPRYDPVHDAWYCDIEFNTGNAYFPFVRFGLVRYQPKSIPGCELSTIVATSFVQTLPDRTLTVIESGAQELTVKLHGPAPQARCALDGTVLAGTNTVVAVIEEQTPRLEDSFLGWKRIGEETILSGTPQADGTALWSGEVPMPANEARRIRLTVCEYELLRADDRSAGAPSVFVEARRLVHADVMELP